MYVQEKDKDIYRYQQYSAPRWFMMNFKVAEFDSSPYLNNLLAFFHFNEGDCQILPSNYVLKNGHPHIDIDRNLYFLKMVCSSVEEARRRAVVLAYLTYHVHKHHFV